MDSERYVLVGRPVSSVLFTNDPAVVVVRRTQEREREREKERRTKWARMTYLHCAIRRSLRII